MKNKIFSHFKDYKFRVVLIFFLLIFENGIWLLNTFVNISLTDYAIKGSASGFLKFLILSIALMLLLLVIKTISKKEIFKLSMLCANDLRDKYTEQFYYNFTTDKLNQSGNYVSNLTADILFIQSNAFEGVFNLISAYLSIGFSLMGAFVIHWSFIVIFPITMLISMIVPNLLSKKFQDLAMIFSNARGLVIKKFTDIFNGADIIKRNNAKGFLKKSVFEYGSEFENENYNYKRKSNFYHTLIAMSSIFSQFIYVLATLVLVLLGYITVGSIVGLFNISQSIYTGVSQIFSQKAQIVSTYPIFDKLLLDYKKENSKIKLKGIDSIEFKNLNFKYDDKDVFKDFNFKIDKGENVAIIGKSGSGKSTLVKLLLKELPSTESVFINGNRIEDISSHDLYEKIAIVNQKPYLFNTSVRKNVKLDNEYDDKRILKILRNLKIDRFEDSSNLLDTVISQNGQNISGGELQRIVIAREIIGDKDVLILDEGLSAIDSETKNIIEDYIFKNEDLTIISILHPRSEEELNIYDKALSL